MEDLLFISWTIGELGWILGGLLGLYCVHKLATFVYDEITSPLHDLSGPPSKSFLYGHFKDLFGDSGPVLQEKWTREYGTTFKYKGILGTTSLYTTDLKALNHFLVNDYNYQKPDFAMYNIKLILGEGVLLVEGDAHRQQRRLLNPAFGLQQIRELTEVFVNKSTELRDVWLNELSKEMHEYRGPTKIDVLSGLSRMTLDVIGLAGFNYNFDSLSNSGETNELSEALTEMFRISANFSYIATLRGLVPALRFLRASGDTEAKVARDTMERAGRKLLAESKAAISQSEKDGQANNAKDILSLLVRANTRKDLPKSQRLSDEDVLAQIPTFLVAGHETISVATTWALFALSQNKCIQDKLRAEVMAVSTDYPTMDELNSLLYLEAVVRETLRVHAPIPATIRCAMKDDVVPLSQPYTDKKGKKHNSIMIKKGQTIMIPMTQINIAKDLWGEDAEEFVPERWGNLPEDVSAIPGVWGNMMTFIGGPKACIGYRFSLVEMKALLFTLIRAFEFDLAVPSEDISKKFKPSIASRPVLLTANPKEENQMPMFISHARG